MLRTLFDRRKRSIGVFANQSVLANEIAAGGATLRDLILNTPGLLAYYEYEGIVMDGVIDFTVSPVDSGPNGYDWTSWDAQTPQFGGPPSQVQPYAGAVGECYKGSNEARAGFPVPAVDAPPFMDDVQGCSLEFWIQRSEPANGENLDLLTGIVSLGEQHPINVHIHRNPTPSFWDYDIQVQSDAFSGSVLSGTLIGSDADADFHYIVVTILPGGDAILYYDGVARDTQPAPAGISCTITPPTGLCWNMDGIRVDETAWYQGILTPAMVLARFNAVP